jgi:hypothetical protein
MLRSGKQTSPDDYPDSSPKMSSSILAPQPLTSSYDAPVGRFAQDWSVNRSHAYVWFAYIVAGGIAAVAAYLVDLQVTIVDQTLLLAGIADIVATIVVWIAAIFTNNSSLYDPYWSVFTPLATVYWAAIADDGVPMARKVLVNVSVWVWAWRLTTNWAFAWPGLCHQDWRYADIEALFRSKGPCIAINRLKRCFLRVLLNTSRHVRHAQSALCAVAVFV